MTITFSRPFGPELVDPFDTSYLTSLALYPGVLLVVGLLAFVIGTVYVCCRACWRRCCCPRRHRDPTSLSDNYAGAMMLVMILFVSVDRIVSPVA